MDVGGWLRSLGLAQYEDAFRDNAIDDSVLPSLTVEQPARFATKVTSMPWLAAYAGSGATSSLYFSAPSAIVALRAHASEPPHAPPSFEASANDAAERRQVKRSGRFDRALHPTGPGRPAGNHFGLSPMCH